jgi:hypothetical protein
LEKSGARSTRFVALAFMRALWNRTDARLKAGATSPETWFLANSSTFKMPAGRRRYKILPALNSSLDFVDFFEDIWLRHFFRAIETLAAFPAAVGAVGQEKKDPKFHQASPLGAVDVLAATQRTIPLLGVNEQA